MGQPLIGGFTSTLSKKRGARRVGYSGDVDAIEAFVAVSDPSIEHTRLPAAFGPEAYCGHDGVRRWFTDMADLWREWRNEIEELVEVGPHTVAARVRFIAVGRDSGVPVEARLGLVCVLSEGNILRSHTYARGEAALGAVGLSEQDAHADS